LKKPVPNSADTGKVAGWQDPQQGDFAKPDCEENCERPAARQPNIVPAARGRKAPLLLAHRHDSISAGMTLPRSIWPDRSFRRCRVESGLGWPRKISGVVVPLSEPPLCLRHRLLRRAARPEAVAVLTECRVPPRLEAAAVVVDAEPGRVEFARDSPLEGNGFEPSVPGTNEPVLSRKANCGTERGTKRVVSYAVPMVRIHLPPADSQSLSRSRF
jgi:hypothetical protein